MRVAALFTAAFAALAAAQSSSTTRASSGSVAGSQTTTSKSPVQTCLDACRAGDVTCQAACVGVPHPGSQQMNDTTSCVAKCDQGDGSAADNKAYGQCRDACISSYIVTSTLASVQAGEGTAVAATVPAGVTPSSGSGTATMTSMGASGSSGTESTGSTSGASQTTNSAQSTSSGAAVGQAQMGASAGGIAGLVLAVLAL